MTCGQHGTLAEWRVNSMDKKSKIARIIQTFGKCSRSQVASIQVVLDNPGANTTTLSERMGKKSNTWQLIFGDMCNKYKDDLWTPENFNKNGRPYYSGLLVD
jgi:hypothetical protein